MKDCNVHVYERSTMGYKRISAFDHPVNPETKPVVRVLYCGGVHYGWCFLFYFDFPYIYQIFQFYLFF